MKKNYSLSLVVLFLLFVTCSKFDVDKNYLSEDEAYQIGLKYLKLENGLYTFIMTEKEAIKNNISLKDYDRMAHDVKQTNQAIKDTTHNSKIAYFEPQLNSDLILRSVGPNAYGIPIPDLIGQIKTYDGYWGYASVFISDSVSYLEIHCNSVGFLQLFNIIVGGQSASGVGYAGWWNTKIYPEYSNTTATCGFKTSNSSGGICNIIANFKPEVLN